MVKKGTLPRTRAMGNAVMDSLPDLVQELYHAVGTPMGVGNFEWAKECLKKGVDVNARLDVYGGNALFLAIEQSSYLMVKWLVEEACIDLELVDYGGFNALDYAAACHQYHPESPPQLPDGSAAPMDIASYLKAQGMKYTWFGAAMAEDIDRIWEFLENGQDVNERGGHFNRNAAEEALDNGNYWTSQFIFVKGGMLGIQPDFLQYPDESECKVFLQGKLM